MTSEPVLVLMDSGNDAIGDVCICDKDHVDFIIKRKIRKTQASAVADDWSGTRRAYKIKRKDVYTGRIMRKVTVNPEFLKNDKLLNSQSTSRIFGILTYEQRVAFFKKWVQKSLTNGTVCYGELG